MAADFTLQLLHASDFEAGLDAVQDAPRFAAVIDKLEDQYTNSITVSSGDNWISGPFYSAGGDPLLNAVLDSGATAGTQAAAAAGRPSVEIHNRMGVEISNFGNHEYDLGTNELNNVFSPNAGQDWRGAQFAVVQTNIDYLPADALAARETAGLQEASAIKGRIAPSAIITEGGQKIGFVGLTTPTINSIASPGPNVGILPAPGSVDLDAIAAALQPTINALVAAGANKIVLLSHMQQYTFEVDLAPKLQHVDIIVAGGSDAIFADGTDPLRPGDVASESYPVIRSSVADGRPIAIVNTDGTYRYVGRLVVGFDANGVLDVSTIDPNVSGAYATTDAGVAALWGAANPYAPGTRAGAVKEITDAVGAVINSKDGNRYGQSEVFLEGRRALVRTEETNLGNMTADANLFRLGQIDPTTSISIKNGGGIRDSIGIIDVNGDKLATAANPGAGKLAGQISQLDVENSLRFNNELSLVTVSAANLKRILEHGVSATGPGQTPGQFSQVGGIAFSFDATRPAQVLQGNPGTGVATVTQEGQRIRSLVVKDEFGNTLDVVVANGQVVGNPNRTFRIATLRFMIDDPDNDGRGGDNYPFRTFGTNVVNTGIFEQTALSDYLTSKFPAGGTTFFAEEEAPPAQDQRIQNLAFRSDTVVNPLSMNDLGASGALAGAEISAYDPTSRRLFVTSNNGLQILDYSNPASPTLITTINLTTFGHNSTDITSVAANGGLIAVTLPDLNKDQPGKVVFFDSAGNHLGSVPVGYLPDSLVFTPNGARIVVANEGEPLPPAAAINPEGSVSVITVNRAALSSSTVQNVTFTGPMFNADRLRNQGVRITAGLTAAQDFEPEYISIAPDGVTAFITLQENRAVVTLNTATATFTDIKALGLKDWSKGLPILENYQFNPADLPSIGMTTANQEMFLGGFSGLFFEGIDPATGNWKFITNTDRGPNGEPTDLLPIAGAERPFALPSFQPRLVRFQLSRATGRISITEQILLTKYDGATPLTGLPNLQAGAQGSPHTDEIPIDLFGNQLPNDPIGADLEGIVVAVDGSFWMGDEYRPAIYHFSPTGKLLERFIPVGTHAAGGQPVPAPGTAGVYGIEALPAVLGERRRANRGIEAIVLDPATNKLYAFVQTTLDNPNTSTTGVRDNGNIRIIEFNLASKAVTAEYVYTMNDTTAAGLAKTDKIGDAVWVGQGRILVVERDDRTGRDSNKLIYEIDLTGATNTLSLPNPLTGPPVVAGQTIEQLDASELVAAGVRTVNKRLVANAAALGYTGVSKVEGLALIDANTIAVINDNDFGVQPEPIAGNGSVPLRASPEPIQLGVIEFTQSNKLDPSDQDGAGGAASIRLNNWPVFGMYMPDGIASFTIGTQVYYITANEGDDRNDFVNPDETRRIGSGATVLDPTKFPNAATLKQNVNLGRLDHSILDGDLDADGDFDQLRVYGGRSFSIWDSVGNRVYDSGDSLEQITARLLGLPNFNLNDTRSDNKGPEPENVVTGVIGDRTYAFVALERTNGIMAYDVTNPNKPEFVQYIASAGDSEPEGLLFISANDSPTGRPLLVVSNEASRNVRTYQINVPSGPVINEFVFNHVSTDTREFVEILAAPNADLSAYALLQIEGDNSGSQIGVINSVHTLSTADAAGYWSTGFLSDVFQNGTSTLLLVKQFTGSVGSDLDANNDGVLDVLPWQSIVDSIAVNDGGSGDRAFSTTVLGTTFGGGSQTVGGASRIPNGTDTNAASDWLRNDFDLAGVPGFAGTPVNGEAFNTPKAINQAISVTPTDLVIPQIQGVSHTSPYVGTYVRTTGIITARRVDGFYIQTTTADADLRTSEAIFVFTASAPAADLQIGAFVRVVGSVTEFGFSGGLTTTEIVSPFIVVDSTGNPLPAPTVIGQGGRTPPTQVIEDDAFASFDPATDGLDFYESLEGMRVQLNNAVAVGPTVTFGSGPTLNREIAVLADNGVGATGRTPRGGIIRSSTDTNPERIFLSDALLNGDNVSDPALPGVRVGHAFDAALLGILGYDFGNYLFLNTEAVLPSVTSAILPQETTSLVSSADQLTVATFNVENLDPNDPQAKFDQLADIIIANLKSPDLLSVEEIQDNNGATNNGTVAANLTWTRLIQTITGRGGPTYSFRQIDPENNQDGGEPGGNIRVGFLFQADRVSFVDRAGGSSTGAVNVVNGASGPELSYSPGRIDPTNAAFTTSRKPLVGEFVFNGQKLFIVANHFNSKGGDQAEFGSNQPPVLTTEAQRIAQATAVKSFVQSILALNASANVIVMGDLNDFEYSTPLTILESAGLTTMINTLPANERYTYVFDGNSQSLDHIMVSGNLIGAGAAAADVVHVNSEFIDSERASDHDPVVARFLLPGLNATSLTSVTRTGPVLNRADGFYYSSLTVANSSAGTLDGGFRIHIKNLTPGVTLSGASVVVGGVTYNLVLSTSSSGAVTVSLPKSLASTLTAGASLPKISLKFANPQKKVIAFDTEVYAGL